MIPERGARPKGSAESIGCQPPAVRRERHGRHRLGVCQVHFSRHRWPPGGRWLPFPLWAFYRRGAAHATGAGRVATAALSRDDIVGQRACRVGQVWERRPGMRPDRQSTHSWPNIRRALDPLWQKRPRMRPDRRNSHSVSGLGLTQYGGTAPDASGSPKRP